MSRASDVFFIISQVEVGVTICQDMSGAIYADSRD